MEINIKDILTLEDDNDYVVVSKANANDKNYYFLVNIEHNEKFLFCYEDKGDLVEIKDKELITKLTPLFFQNSKHLLKDFIEKFGQQQKGE